MTDAEIQRIVDYLRGEFRGMVELLQRLALAESPSDDPAAVAPVIEHHDRGVLAEAVRVVGEVLLRPAEAVDEQQRRAVTGDLDGQADAVVHLDAHAPSRARNADRLGS